MANNFLVCQNCGEKNPLFSSKCGKCHHYLRATIPNIDLWSTIWKIFESPVEALTNVIYAEHKNFISFLTFFVSVKFLRAATERKSIRNTFIAINFFTLLFITILSIDKLIKVF